MRQHRIKQMSNPRPLVGVAVPAATGFGRQIMRGVMRYANLRRRWLMIQEFNLETADPDTWPDCDGTIVTAVGPRLEQFRRRCRHLVVCSGSADPQTAPVVCLDDIAAGRMAADHLIECGLKQFGYYGATLGVSTHRLEGFRGGLGERGLTCYQPPVEYQWTARPHWTTRPHWPALVQWIRALPKPVGLFAMDDIAAADLAAACVDAGIPVPERVAILGVNNDDLICESAWPPLSSIATASSASAMPPRLCLSA